MNRETNIRNVRITGGFWKEKQDLVREVTIPYIREALEDKVEGIERSGVIHNFEVAAGRKKGDFYGLVSQDSDLFKWIEAASYALLEKQGSGLARDLEEIAALLAEAQQKDGYLNTYYILNGLKHRWDYLKESCQLYCAGHFLEAAVAHYQVTGSRIFLDIACRYADCIDRSFGKEAGKIKGYDGHAEIELALFRLYDVTNEDRYRKLAEFFVEERGKSPSFFREERHLGGVRDNLVYELEEEDYSHSQSHMPIREQKEAKGHAVKAMYFYSAAADEARLEGDKELHQVLNNLWEDVTERKMYLTGAIGAREYGESFSYAYDLPLDMMYGETCASIGLFFWAFRMLLLENNGRYADVMETALFNGILCGLSEDGKKFFYTNVLEADPKKCDGRKEYSHIMKERQPWFACPCCPPNIARLILSLQKYIYTLGDRELWVHQYIGSELKEDGWIILQETGYPQEGEIQLTVSSGNDGTLHLRIPGWCREYTLKRQDGGEVSSNPENGYITVPIKKGIRYEFLLKLLLEPEKIYASDAADSMLGKAAVQYGPVVFCGEEVDNPDLRKQCLKRGGFLKRAGMEIYAEGYQYENIKERLYGKQGFSLQPCEIKMIPYFRWNNRGIGRMKTFFDERGDEG